MGVGGQRHAPAALPRERDPGPIVNTMIRCLYSCIVTAATVNCDLSDSARFPHVT